jgi:hypothetical protein
VCGRGWWRPLLARRVFRIPAHPVPRHCLFLPPTRSPQVAKTGSTGTFTFTRVLGLDAKQDAVFDSIARPLVERAVSQRGSDGLLFAYGEQGSGTGRLHYQGRNTTAN